LKYEFWGKNMKKQSIIACIVVLIVCIILSGCISDEKKQVYDLVVDRLNSKSIETLSLEEDERIGSAELYVDKYEDTRIEKVTGLDGVTFYEVALDYVVYWKFYDYEESHVFLAKVKPSDGSFTIVDKDQQEYSYHAFYNYWDSNKIFENPFLPPHTFNGYDMDATHSFILEVGKKVKIEVSGTGGILDMDMEDLTLYKSKSIGNDYYGSEYVTSSLGSILDESVILNIHSTVYPGGYDPNNNIIEPGIYYFEIDYFYDWNVKISYV
jgi:hypothetical protein